MYGDKSGKLSLNEYRCNVFKQSLLKEKSKLDSLPPTEDSVKWHSFRVYLQIQKWFGNDLNPSEWEWEFKNEFFECIRSQQEPAPESILKIIPCGCIGDCSSARCTCNKADIKCSILCKTC